MQLVPLDSFTSHANATISDASIVAVYSLTIICQLSMMLSCIYCLLKCISGAQHHLGTMRT